MRRIRRVAAAMTMAGLLTASEQQARAFPTVTTVVGGLTTVAGAAVLIYFLVIKKDEKPAQSGSPEISPPPAEGPSSPPPPPPPPASGALLYLRQAGPQLAADLVSGTGPALTMIEDALELPVAHRPAFEHSLRRHRPELLPLTDPATLTPERSVAFLQRVVELARQDRDVAADVAAWAARMKERTRG